MSKGHPSAKRRASTPFLRGWKHGRALLRPERGASLVEFALMLPFLALMLLGVIDFGRAYYLSIEVNNAAYAGAMYGARNTSDVSGMESAASAEAANVPGGLTFPTAPQYGCECSDGTNAVAPCSNPVPACNSPAILTYYVTVTTSASYKVLFPWPGVPSPLTLQGKATIRTGQ